MSAERSASIGTVQILRAATYFVALLVVSTAALLAYVSSVLVYASFGMFIAAVLVLLVHQRVSLATVSSMILLVLAYIVPATLVRTTFDSGGCTPGIPCDPVPNSHPGLRLGLAAVLLFAALITAAVGAIRSSRLTNAPHLRRHELA